METEGKQCNTFWGTHGCDLIQGHEMPCECRHEGDEQGPGDISKLVKLENPMLIGSHKQVDPKFGVVFYDDSAIGYLVNWFTV